MTAQPGPDDLRFAAGWHAALAEAWSAYGSGSLPIGVCVVNAAGHVIAQGRNRLGEPRGVA